MADLQEGIKVYQKCAEKGLEVALEHGLGSARNWLHWAFEREAWKEVPQAYDYAYQAGTRLVQIQLVRQDQESFLKQTQGLAAHAAYALAKENQLTKAAVTLERGLAQLLSEALARERTDLEQLKDSGHGDLYARYQQAIAHWHEAQQAKPEEIYKRLRAAREQLDKTIAAIRQVEGYANFLIAPEFGDIVAAVKDSVLVYLAVTKAGGLALFVNENGEIRLPANVTPWMR